MKKIMLVMLGSAILATSAVSKETPTKPAAKSAQTSLSRVGNKKTVAVLDATIWGVNQLNNNVYVQATNTSTSQAYYMTIPYKNSTSITLPPGNYDIYVSLGSSFGNIYVSNLNNYSALNKNWWTFYGINITASPSTVVSVGT
jgi:hypothetical protein